MGATTEHQDPWAVYLTPELREREGPFSHFAAWELWMSERVHADPYSNFYEWFDDAEITDRVFLYSLFCQAIGMPPKPADSPELF